MLFHSNHRTPEFIPTVNLNSLAISAVNECSFVGIIRVSDLEFTRHIAYLKRKLPPGIRILLKARYKFSKPTLLTLYYSLINSHVNYNTYIAPLQHSQNQAIRALSFS